jgi:chromosomal replication initiator protein
VKHQLGEAGDLLCERLGDTPFRAWFSDVQFEGVEGDTLKLSVPRAYVKTRLIEHYETHIIRCWREGHSMRIERVELSVRA